MRNEERLLQFLYRRWEELGKPDSLPLSANEIRKEWTIIKNQRTVVVVPVETHTTRAYVNRLLKKLQAEGKLTYETTKKTNPTISLRSHETESLPDRS